MYLVEYDSNNSGGDWWLSDKDWIALAKAGWNVVWGGFYFCGSQYEYNAPPEGKPTCGLGDECRGHRKFESHEEMTDDDRWLGALAREATKEFADVREAVEEFERVTGQDASAEGCSCCGPPHSFSWRDVKDGEKGEKGESGYASGEGVLPVLYGDEGGPATLRDAYRVKFGR